MPTCKGCGEEVEELQTTTAGGKRRRLCEDCVEQLESEQGLMEESEAVVQQMMGFKGRR